MSSPFPLISFHLRAHNNKHCSNPAQSLGRLIVFKPRNLVSHPSSLKFTLEFILFSDVKECENYFCFYSIILCFILDVGGGGSIFNPNRSVFLPVLGVFVVDACGSRPQYWSWPI